MGLLSNREPRKTVEIESDDDKKTYKTMAFKVEEDLQSAMKIHCVRTGKVMANELNDLIREFLIKNDAL